MDYSNKQNQEAISLLISKDKWSQENTKDKLTMLGAAMAKDFNLHLSEKSEILIVCNNTVADDFAKGFYQTLSQKYPDTSIAFNVNWWTISNGEIEFAVNKKSYTQKYNKDNLTVIVLANGHDKKDKLSTLSNLMRALTNVPKTTKVYVISPIMDHNMIENILSSFQSFNPNIINALEVNIFPEKSNRTQIAYNYIKALRNRNESSEFNLTPKWLRDIEHK